MNRLFSILLLFFLIITSEVHAEDFHMSGYYKNLFITSQSQVSSEDFYADINRLRLELKGEKDPWQFFVAVDNEAIINDFSHTPDFNIIRSKSQNFLTQADVDKVSTDDDHLYLKHSLHRAYIQYYDPRYQATVGKQSIDWGRMRFYSPVDLFNPVGPLDLEPDERAGIDAINLNFTTGDNSSVNVITAPGRNDDESSFGAKLGHKIAEYDIALMAASVRTQDVIGFLFDGYLKAAGLRGEVTQTWRDDHKNFARAAVGIDYNFNEKFYALFEQFYNGGHEDNAAAVFSSSYRVAREVLSLKRNISTALLKITLTPLLTFSQTILYDWDGESFAVNPELIYNATQNLDLRMGVQAFDGASDSEFGDTQHLFYAELKWFF